MDPVTHTLTGALTGQAGLKRKTGLAMPALLVGANLPDIDVACFLWLEGVEHLAFRRGITHGPIAWVLLPLLLAGALWWFDRWQAKRGKRPPDRLPVHFGWLYALSFLACLTHPALDWLNVYGVRLLEPFSSRWFYGDTLFIIDVWLWAIMGVGLWLSLRWEKRGAKWRRPAQVAIALGLTYIGANGIITHAHTRQIEPHIAAMNEHIASPAPLAFWRRENLVGTDHGLWLKVENGNPLLTTSQDALIASSSDLVSIDRLCLWQRFEELGSTRSDVEAFLFWSRAPFAERAPDGSVLIRDARYYDPRARNRFTVVLPDVRCEPVSAPVRAEERPEAAG